MSSTRRRKHKNEGSACVGLSKKRCSYPCKGVKKHKGSSEFGHCQSMFSRKKNKMDKRTQRIVRECIRKGRQSEKKEKHLRKKSGVLKVTGDKAIEKAVVLEKEAEVVGDEKKGYLSSATDALSMATNIFGSAAPAEKAVDVEKESETSAPVAEPEPAPVTEPESAPSPETPEPEDVEEEKKEEAKEEEEKEEKEEPPAAVKEDL
jgi:hypothetical protein